MFPKVCIQNLEDICYTCIPPHTFINYKNKVESLTVSTIPKIKCKSGPKSN